MNTNKKLENLQNKYKEKLWEIFGKDGKPFQLEDHVKLQLISDMTAELSQICEEDSVVFVGFSQKPSYFISVDELKNNYHKEMESHINGICYYISSQKERWF